MATAPSPTTRPRRPARAAEAPPRWRRWLVLGLCFGLGHGVTQRLLEVRWGDDSSRPPAFRAPSPPEGTALEELRRQHGEQGGGKAKPLPADLDTLAREKREAQQKQEAAKRERAERQKAALQAEQDRLEGDRRRLEEFNGSPAPAANQPAAREVGAPELPVSDPYALEQPLPIQDPPAATRAPSVP